MERSRLRRCAAEAAWALAETREWGGDPSGAAEWGQRAVSFSPGDEVALRRLLALLDRLGDRAAAVRAYEAFARDLEREYELVPSEATRDLLARIRAEQTEGGATRPVLQGAAPPAVAAERSAHVSPRMEPQRQELGVGVAIAGLGGPRDVDPPARTDGARRLVPVLAAAWRRIPLGTRVASAALLALIGVGAWRLGARAQAGAVPTLPERVIIADFTSLTSDSTFGDLVAHVLNSELARSPVLTVVGRETIGDALRRMRRQPGTRLTPDVAREVAARQQINLVVEGDVRPAGDGLVITAAVTEVSSGDMIHGASERARDSSDVLAAIKRVSDGIRQGIGESRASIQATDKLWSFTTSSLPALRKHMAGSRAYWRGDYQMAAELSEEATRLDPEFAHAYLLLSNALGNAGLPRGRALRPLMRAYELRDRLTERERYAVEGIYLLRVIGDVPKAIAALRKHIEALKQLPVGEPGWYASLGHALVLTGDFPEAERVLQEARQRHPTPANLTRLIAVLYAEGKVAEARQVLDELSRRHPEHPTVGMLRVHLLADSGRYDDAHALAAQLRRPNEIRTSLKLQAELDAVQGRVDEAVAHLREMRDQALARADVVTAAEVAGAIGRLRLVAGDSAGASEVDDLLARHPVDSLEPLSRPYLPLALFYAEAGQARRARTWLAAYERDVPPQFQGPDAWMLHRARAALRRAEGKPEQALAELREGARVPAIRVGLFDEPSIRTSEHTELARVYDELGLADSAIAVYERYVTVRSLDRIATDAFELGTALERLGALHEKRGDSVRAAERYGRLGVLWRGADGLLRQRAELAAQHAAALKLMARR